MFAVLCLLDLALIGWQELIDNFLGILQTSRYTREIVEVSNLPVPPAASC